MLSILRKARLADKELRVLFLGLDNAGKTTVVKRILNPSATGAELRADVSPTLGFEIKTIEWGLGGSDGEGGDIGGKVRINVWDVGGQKTLRTYWQNYFEKTDTLVWVVDGTDVARLEDTRDELAKLLLEERLTGASLLILVNKSDVPDCLSSAQVEHALALPAISDTHHRAILECSAMTGQNLVKAMDWVVQDARERLFIF